MRQLLPFRTAANALLGLFTLAILFQLAVLAGLVPTEIVWGGQLEGDDQRMMMTLVSLAMLLLMVAIVLVRMGRLGRWLPAVGRWGIWAIVVLFAINTVGNLAAKDLRETLIFTPVTLVAALLAWRVALGNDDTAS